MNATATPARASRLLLWALVWAASSACSFSPAGVQPTDDGGLAIDASSATDASVLDATLPDASAPQPNTARRKQLTIDGSQVPGALNDFPVLVRLVDSELADSASADGLDIFFTDATGKALFFERVSYDQTTGTLLAWVLMDLTGADQDFYVYYGDGNTVELASRGRPWASGFSNVWHMEENAGNRIDATANSAATPIGAPGVTPGVVGNAVEFDGIDDALQFQNSLSGDQAHTISFWLSETGDQNQLPFGVGTWMANDLRFLRIRSDDRIGHGFHSNGAATPTALPAGWHHVTWVFEGAPTYIGELFIDGASVQSHTYAATMNTTGTDGRIGQNYQNNSEWLLGAMDEVHFSDVARSADWIATAYNNQRADATFIAVGNEEVVEPAPKRKPLTIAGAEVPSPLAGFPVLVRTFADSDLASSAHPNARDIHFEDANGQPLPFERARYNRINGTLTAWVKVDLTGADQLIYLRYGDRTLTEQSNPAAVWDNSYAGVWHLEESPSGPYRDATGAGHDSTSIAGVTRIGGHVGVAVEIDPSNGGIVVGDVAATGDITISAWLDVATLTNEHLIVTKRDFISNLAEYELLADRSLPGDLRFSYNIDGALAYAWHAQSALLQEGAGWQHVTVTHRTGQPAHFHLDGAAAIVGTQASGVGAPARQSHPGIDTVLGGGIGAPANTNWSGGLDEVRISTVVRSQDWITAEYNNQRSGSTFLTIGAEESL